jgi:hypothetical protein
MQEVSQILLKNVIQKNMRSREIVARKWVAYQELIGPDTRYSQRLAAQVIKIPRCTLQYWHQLNLSENELDVFFSGPIGLTFLHKTVSAALFVIQYRNSGSRGLQEFLQLSGLDRWVASSTGTMYSFAHRWEAEIASFGREQQRALSEGMPRRKIALSEDETFHVGRPCLVAIELLSNYILVEKYAEQRREEDWNLATKEALAGLNVEILSSTTDGGTALAAHVKRELKTEQAPDLFHVQQDFSRATAGTLKAQERELEKDLEKAQKTLNRAIEKQGIGSLVAQEAEQAKNLKAYGLDQRKARREEVKAAISGIGRDFHPINPETGEWQSSAEVQTKLEARVEKIETAAREAKLGESCLKKIAKAKNQIAPMLAYLAYFFLLLKRVLEDRAMSSESQKFFLDVLIPLAYCELVFKKTPTKKRKPLEANLERLRALAREGPLLEQELVELRQLAAEMASWFQRSSSCVEGRNGVLDMKHHGSHRLSQQRLSALTVVHNFHIRRPDKTTPAERFFQKQHEQLFEAVLRKVPMLGRPRKNGTLSENLAA